MIRMPSRNPQTVSHLFIPTLLPFQRSAAFFTFPGRQVQPRYLLAGHWRPDNNLGQDVTKCNACNVPEELATTTSSDYPPRPVFTPSLPIAIPMTSPCALYHPTMPSSTSSRPCTPPPLLAVPTGMISGPISLLPLDQHTPTSRSLRISMRHPHPRTAIARCEMPTSHISAV